MRTDDFDYELPQELIAQTPLEKRDESRLLVLDKETGEIEHKMFYDITQYLNPGDALVINDTKVIPARIIGEKEDTKAVIELLLLKDIEIWKYVKLKIEKTKKKEKRSIFLKQDIPGYQMKLKYKIFFGKTSTTHIKRRVRILVRMYSTLCLFF